MRVGSSKYGFIEVVMIFIDFISDGFNNTQNRLAITHLRCHSPTLQKYYFYSKPIQDIVQKLPFHFLKFPNCFAIKPLLNKNLRLEPGICRIKYSRSRFRHSGMKNG